MNEHPDLPDLNEAAGIVDVEPQLLADWVDKGFVRPNPAGKFNLGACFIATQLAGRLRDGKSVTAKSANLAAKTANSSDPQSNRAAFDAVVSRFRNRTTERTP